MLDAEATRSGARVKTDHIVTEYHGPSLGVLLDNARDEIIAGRNAGVEPIGILVSQRDFEQVAATKAREERNGIALRIFGIDIHAEPSLGEGRVQLILP